MGILNCTPDSFSDGGQFNALDAALNHARLMLEAGAHIIDIGGESTRPGAALISPSQQCERIIPVIHAIREKLSTAVAISIDTTHSAVASEALNAGANIINDISSGSDPAMFPLVAKAASGIVLMHKRGTPQTMQSADNTTYNNLIDDINIYFNARIELAKQAGIPLEAIAIDPGIGFSKTVEQNFSLLHHCQSFTQHQCPLLIGASRKSFIGKSCQVESHDRLSGSLAAAALATEKGANILRVHDVGPTQQSTHIAWHIANAQ